MRHPSLSSTKPWLAALSAEKTLSANAEEIDKLIRYSDRRAVCQRAFSQRRQLSCSSTRGYLSLARD